MLFVLVCVLCVCVVSALKMIFVLGRTFGVVRVMRVLLCVVNPVRDVYLVIYSNSEQRKLFSIEH